MAWLYKQPESENWWIGQRINGRQVRKSTGTADETEARKLLDEIEAMESAARAGRLTEAFYRELTGNSIIDVSLKSAVDSWQKAIAGSTADKTAERYTDELDRFLTFMKAGDSKPILRTITGDDIATYLAHLRKTLSPGSVNVSRKILSIFWNWAVRTKKASENPVRATKVQKDKKHTKTNKRPFTTDELQKLFTAASDKFWRYMCHGGLYTGLRIGDLICLAKDEIDLRANRLRLTTIKTGAVVEIPIATPFRAILEPLVKKARGKYLWPKEAALYQRPCVGAGPFSNDFYEKVMYRAGLVPKRSHVASKDANGERKKPQRSAISFHSFRHTFISLLKTSGVSQSVAKALAAHASDEISDLYTHVSPEHMEHAIKQLPEVTS